MAPHLKINLMLCSFIAERVMLLSRSAHFFQYFNEAVIPYTLEKENFARASNGDIAQKNVFAA